ncbi:MAG: penicillin-binding protein activator [Gallionella sp.]
MKKPVPVVIPAPTVVIEEPVITPLDVPLLPPVTVAPIIEEPAWVVNANARAHIALLLPLNDKNFGAAATAVQQGFMAAANLDSSALPIQVYSVDESRNVAELYRQAVMNGAQAVVGPLTRKGVASLAAMPKIPVATLALNNIDAPTAEQLFSFGMALDDEARSVAQLAMQRDLHKVIVITGHTPLAQRMQLAFEEVWSSAGRSIVSEIDFKGDTSVLKGLSNIPDTLIFLATDAENARHIRPFLPAGLPIYSTSQIFLGNEATLTNYDLNGVRFVDMPWLLQPDHAAVMGFPRSATPLSADEERLYALGIDAYQLIRLILAHNEAANMPLNGVSGIVRLQGHNFLRSAVPGIFKQGRAISTEAAAKPDTQMFPDQFKPRP